MPNDSRMLSRSRVNVDDEFYTLYEDIADELVNYREQFRGAHVICPCDWDESFEEVCVYAAPGLSGNIPAPVRRAFEKGLADGDGRIEKDVRQMGCNFVKYLVSHAEDWGVASVCVSGYNPVTGEGTKFQDLDYSGYNLVVTNPPFSQFIDFVEVMFRHGLRFLVIGPQNAITYQSVFLHMMRNEMWLGYHYHLAGFIRPDGTRVARQDNLARSCGWFTNLEVTYRNRRQMYDMEYDPELYPKYDNYDAIEVGKSKMIPDDYDGPMGVPVTFLQKYSPLQFEILGMTDNTDQLAWLRIPGQKKYDRPYLHGERKYPRLIIRRIRNDE